MNKVIMLILTVLGTTLANAEIGFKVILEPAHTNYVTRGTTRVAAVNSVSAAAHFGSATAVTNLAYLATNNIAAVPSTTVQAVIGGAATAVSTNTFYFNRSADGVNWTYWTNVVQTYPNTAIKREVFELTTLGAYSFVQLGSISNSSLSGLVRSNYVSLHWK